MSGDATVTASKQFVADFEAVATRYNLRELGEYADAKAAARRDLDNAEVCFAAMAREALGYPKGQDAKKALEAVKRQQEAA